MSESAFFIDLPSGRRLEATTMAVRTLPRASAKALKRRGVDKKNAVASIERVHSPPRPAR
jgi:hypothetical protein